jgi:ABC-type branched-subunit amino acid transport system substrate-binding protein
VPVLFPLTVEPALDDPRRSGFLLGPDGAALARVAALFALEQGWDTAATFSAPGPGPALAPVVFAEAFEAGGGTAGLDLVYADGVTADFADQVARLEGPRPQDEPEVIFTAMPTGQLSVLQAELGEARIGSAVLTVDGRAPVDRAGAPAAGTLMVGRAPDGDVDRVDWFDDAFRDAGGEGFDDPLAAARVADAILVLVAAIEQAGEEPGDLAALLAAGTLIEGVSGVVGTGPPATRPESIPVVELTDDGPVLVALLPA